MKGLWESSFGSKEKIIAAAGKRSAGTKLAALKARKMITATGEKNGGAELGL